MQDFPNICLPAGMRAKLQCLDPSRVVGRLSLSITAGMFGVVAVFMASAPAWAGGEAGKRFFPSTIAIEDPFVADELALPSIAVQRKAGEGENPANWETGFSFEYSKRITPDLAFSVGWGGTHVSPDGMSGKTGANNVELGIKYSLFKSEEHETLLSAGLSAEIGHTGCACIDAEPYTVWTPALYFGKGMGDLPDSMALLKPFAVTGLIGVAIPSDATTMSEDGLVNNPDKLKTGFAIQYNFRYLQSYVMDIGLRAPFDRVIPIVEFSFDTPLDRGGGMTTGTVNPGIIWVGDTFQAGVEAIIPINEASGQDVGVRGALHFYLDDMFPNSFIGRPLFGQAKEDHD